MGVEVVVSVGYMTGYEYEEDKVTTMDRNETQSRRTLITRDLLGVGVGHGIGAGAAASDSPGDSDLNSKDNNYKIEYQEQHHELDLDLQVPSGWEKRLDLQSGKVYLQMCNSAAPTSSSYQRGLVNHCVPKFQDLNFLHPSQKLPLNLFDDAFLDLKLVPSSSSSPSAGNYNSVCTLDKVRYALERAEKEPNIKKRSPFWKPSSSSPSPSPSHSSSSSYSMREAARGEDDNNEENALQTPIAAGCPSCLLYVLISVKDPKCPRCNVPVPLPNPKKPLIDLNMSI